MGTIAITTAPHDARHDRRAGFLEQKWPQTLWIVRHGQSAGNVARDAAELGGMTTIDLADRDADVPLGPRGEAQAQARCHWLAALPVKERSEIVLSSSYLRARQSADRVLRALHGPSPAGDDPEEIACVRDERLREKEFGILDRLTPLGIRAQYPELASSGCTSASSTFGRPAARAGARWSCACAASSTC